VRKFRPGPASASPAQQRHAVIDAKVKVFYDVSDLCTAHRASWPICARTG
jgi:hypothetical protein